MGSVVYRPFFILLTAVFAAGCESEPLKSPVSHVKVDPMGSPQPFNVSRNAWHTPSKFDNQQSPLKNK